MATPTHMLNVKNFFDQLQKIPVPVKQKIAINRPPQLDTTEGGKAIVNAIDGASNTWRVNALNALQDAHKGLDEFSSMPAMFQKSTWRGYAQDATKYMFPKETEVVSATIKSAMGKLNAPIWLFDMALDSYKDAYAHQATNVNNSLSNTYEDIHNLMANSVNNTITRIRTSNFTNKIGGQLYQLIVVERKRNFKSADYMRTHVQELLHKANIIPRNRQFFTDTIGTGFKTICKKAYKIYIGLASPGQNSNLQYNISGMENGGWWKDYPDASKLQATHAFCVDNRAIDMQVLCSPQKPGTVGTYTTVVQWDAVNWIMANLWRLQIKQHKGNLVTVNIDPNFTSNPAIATTTFSQGLMGEKMQEVRTIEEMLWKKSNA